MKHPHLVWMAVLAAIIVTGCSQPVPTTIPALPTIDVTALNDQRLRVETQGDGIRALPLPGELPAGTEINLTLSGEPVPYRLVERDGQAWLIFWAEQNRSRYTDHQVYFIHFGQPGVTMPETVPSDTDHAATGSALFTQEYEENSIYTPLAGGDDPWMWQKLLAPGESTLDVNLEADAVGDGVFKLSLWANTGNANQTPQLVESPEQAEHILEVIWDGQSLGTLTWIGQGQLITEFAISGSDLQAGAHQLLLRTQLPEGKVVDIVHLNSFQISFPVQLSSSILNRSIEVSGRVTVQGLTGTALDVYQRIPDGDVAYLGAYPIVNGQVSVVAAADAEIWLVEPGRETLPVEVKTAQPAITADEFRAVDMLVIAPQDLLTVYQPVMAWHQSQGLKVEGVDLEAVWDSFGSGRAEPETIKTFLDQVFSYGELEYVLLIGDETSDNFEHQTPWQGARIPGFVIYSVFGGETSSDTGYAQMDDDQRPDIAVGRIPARTAEQLQIYVDKVLAFVDQPAKTGAILAVADNSEQSFQYDAQRFLDAAGDSLSTRLVIPDTAQGDAATQVGQAFVDDPLLVAYFGHGSLTQWGKDSLFSVEHVSDLGSNGHYPWMVQMTCLTGYYIHPQVESLTEKLMFTPGSGSVALIAPTSLTLASDQSLLAVPFLQALAADQSQRAGDYFLFAQRQLPELGGGIREVLETFLLFGDPALPLIQP